MSSISTGIGLVSGIDIAGLVDSLTQLARAPVRRLEDRVATFQNVQVGLRTVEAQLLALSTSAQQLGDERTFDQLVVNSSAPELLNVVATAGAKPGAHRFQPLRTASTHSLLSSGFSDPDQLVGEGQLTIARGGGINRPTSLDLLNGGQGVRRGTIRVIDRAGNSADIDLSATLDVDDVLRAINERSDIGIAAAAEGDRLVLRDTSGGSGQLAVFDITGQAAADLGLQGVSSGFELQGDAVYQLSGNFTLDLINDGNQIERAESAADIRITLSNDETIEVNLDDARTLDDVVAAINSHEDNEGKLAASISADGLVLTDLSGGGGTEEFAVEDINTASVTRALGLDKAADGTTITGRPLLAGLNSVLLHNLRGGQGIDETGPIELTDREGNSATVDLTGATSLDEVVAAINMATSGGEPLNITAAINESGTGLVLFDSSGAEDSNLIVKDVGSGTLATQLGIAIDAAVDTVASGNLGHRYVNAATAIEDYAPDGGGIAAGSILIRDSAGNQATVEISSAVKDIGDVLTRINATEGVEVRAELNESGDGFVLIDEADGAGTLTVEEVDSTTAADLRLLGTAEVGDDGKQRVSSRRATVITFGAEDTLRDVVDRINEHSGIGSAEIIHDGSALSPYRISLQSAQGGTAGELFLESGIPGLGFTTASAARDALLRLGEDPSTGFLYTSSNNHFDNVVAGFDVEVLGTSSQVVDVTASLDTQVARGQISAFVNTYNAVVDLVSEATRYNAETEARGPLQGSGIALRLTGRLDSFINGQLLDTDASIRSLGDLGIFVTEGGKLRVNSSTLDDALQQNPDAVAEFFLDEDNGFANALDEVVTSFTDPISGSLKLEDSSLQSNIDSLTQRIDELDTRLVVKRELLLREFVAMENILSSLQSQQQAIGAIQPLQINPTPQGRGN